MKTYQLTYLIASAVTSDQAQILSNEFENFIQDEGGIIIKSEKNGLQTLAFPIKKQSSGYFFTLESQLQEDKIKKIEENFKKDKNILRHIIVVKKPTRISRKGRIRKPPLFKVTDKESITEIFPTERTIKNTGKLKTIDIDKKLDEILGE